VTAPPRIRRATSDDARALTALVREYWAFEGIDGFDAAMCARVLGDFFSTLALGQAWIAEQGGAAVGYLLACFVFSLEHGGLTAEIDELYLVPALRGAGCGRRLLELAEASFEAAGCTNVSLQLGRGNDAGRAFYERCGYRPRAGYELLDKMLPARPRP
jgi:ribosomal protein S18 acetylase RimI-like enzyme